MPIKKWLKQYAVAMPLLFALFTCTQYVKGHSLKDSMAFAVTWACITLLIFAVTRAYNFKRNVYCQLCNDLPEKTADEK